MQEFKMSLDELSEKFTKSEMAMMAWSSNESLAEVEKKPVKASQSVKKVKRKRTQLDELREEFGEEVQDEIEVATTPQPGNLPDRFYNEEGEVDLSKVSGKEALMYLNSKGLKFPLVGMAGFKNAPSRKK